MTRLNGFRVSTQPITIDELDEMLSIGYVKVPLQSVNMEIDSEDQVHQLENICRKIGNTVFVSLLGLRNMITGYWPKHQKDPAWDDLGRTPRRVIGYPPAYAPQMHVSWKE